jgi:hypothetical protein
MSVEYGVEFVRWADFKKKWKEHQNPDFFHEAEDVGAEWIIPVGKGGVWFSSWRATIDFSDHFKKVRKHLSSKQRTKFELFFERFCLSTDQHEWTPIRDLGEDIDETVFFSTISPKSVKKYLRLWDELDMEELRPAFEQCEIDERGYIRTFEDFRTYPRMWGDLLRDAASKDAGIVLTLD